MKSAKKDCLGSRELPGEKEKLLAVKGQWFSKVGASQHKYRNIFSCRTAMVFENCGFRTQIAKYYWLSGGHWRKWPESGGCRGGSMNCQRKNEGTRLLTIFYFAL
jgi:hypothetical protein